MGIQGTFWTPRRLIELRVKSRSMSLEKLCTYFECHPNDIHQAQIYEANKRRLFVGTRKEIINGKTITITCFAAEWADGARHIPSSLDGHPVYN